jgi:hypothetical protein
MFQLCLERVVYVLMKSLMIQGKEKGCLLEKVKMSFALDRGISIAAVWCHYGVNESTLYDEKIKTRSKEVLQPVLKARKSLV